MNLIIKELASKHALYVDGGNGKTNYTFTQESLTEFTELIIRECAQVCQDQPNHYALKTDRDNCAVAIKQHFGVE